MIKLETRYIVKCYSPKGILLWTQTTKNIVVNSGLDDALNKVYRGINYTTDAFYIGLKLAGGGIDPTDTLSSHVGWDEVVNYNGKQSLVLGVESSLSIDNSASPAIFTITDDTFVTGVFACTSTILYGVADIVGQRVVKNQIIKVEALFTISADLILTPGLGFMPTVAQDDFLNTYFKSVNYTANFYVGLKSSSTSWDLTDTMGSHLGWTEAIIYDEAARQSLVLGPSALQVISSVYPAKFTLNTTGDISGSFICKNSSTKGGSDGILYWVTDDATSGPSRTPGVLSVNYALSVKSVIIEPT